MASAGGRVRVGGGGQHPPRRAEAVALAIIAPALVRLIIGLLHLVGRTGVTTSSGAR